MLEPEDREGTIIYPNGLSNSLPKEVQEELVHSIPGLEHAEFLAYPRLLPGREPLLPFTFVIDAMRECVCDTWGADYWIDLLKLCAYVLAALVLGLLVRRVFRKPVRFFTKKIDETGLL